MFVSKVVEAIAHVAGVPHSVDDLTPFENLRWTLVLLDCEVEVGYRPQECLLTVFDRSRGSVDFVFDSAKKRLLRIDVRRTRQGERPCYSVP